MKRKKEQYREGKLVKGWKVGKTDRWKEQINKEGKEGSIEDRKESWMNEHLKEGGRK